MANPKAFSNASKIVALVSSLFYPLIVLLAVEVAKIGILLTILVATFIIFGLGLVSMVLWTYTVYEGSLGPVLVAVVVGIIVMFAVAHAIEYLVKDKLCLTELSLASLVRVLFADLLDRSPTRNSSK